ncbi:hypothetical protein D3C75_1209400 [compost metagenome]
MLCALWISQPRPESAPILSAPISIRKLMVKPLRMPVIMAGKAAGSTTLKKMVTGPALMALAQRTRSGSTFWMPAMVVKRIGQKEDQKMTV